MSNDTDYVESGSSDAGRVAEAIILCIIIAVCVIGNVSLWIVVLRSKALRTVTSMFILGLSGADLFVATVNMPLTVYSIVSGYWRLSSNACVVFGFFNMLSLVSSVLSLCNISINRYFMVVRPSKFKDIYTIRNAVLMIIGVFTVSILLSSPPLFGWCEYLYIPIQSFCFADWANSMSYAFFMIGCCFGIPFGVMTVCNILIFRTVQKSRRRVKMVVTGASPSKKSKSRASDTFEDSVSGNNPKNSRLTFSDVETFSVSNSVKEELTESALNHVPDLNESSDEPIFWEINDTFESKSNNNNNRSDTDSSTVEDKERPWAEQTLLKMETSFLTNVDVRTVSTHWADSTMLEKRSRDLSVLSGESCTDSDKSDKTRSTTLSASPRLLHPNWKTKEKDNKLAIQSTVSKESTDTMVTTADITMDQPSGTSIISSASERKRPVRLPRTASLRRREEIRLATTLAIVVIVFVCSWLPYCISMILSIFHPGGVPRGFHMFTLLIGYANSGCNPIIYGVMNKRFKIGYLRLFCFFRSKQFQLSSDTPSH